MANQHPSTLLYSVVLYLIVGSCVVLVALPWYVLRGWWRPRNPLAWWRDYREEWREALGLPRRRPIPQQQRSSRPYIPSFSSQGGEGLEFRKQ